MRSSLKWSGERRLRICQRYDVTLEHWQVIKCRPYRWPRTTVYGCSEGLREVTNTGVAMFRGCRECCPDIGVGGCNLTAMKFVKLTQIKVRCGMRATAHKSWTMKDRMNYTLSKKTTHLWLALAVTCQPTSVIGHPSVWTDNIYPAYISYSFHLSTIIIYEMRQRWTARRTLPQFLQEEKSQF